MKLIICFLFIIYCNSLDNGLGLTPQMGWNIWNTFGCDINETLIKDSIDALNESGLIEFGYNYINLGDCWQKERKEGNITPIFNITNLVEYAHNKGIKFGLYSSAGKKTPQGKPGSLDFEKQDADKYAEWKIDYLKYDSGENSKKSSLIKMRDCLNDTGHPIFYSLSQWGEEKVATWAKEVGNSWRTTYNISDSWDSMITIIDENDKWYKYAGPGGWNDPDILEVGNGNMTFTEYKTHFGLWCISKAPLLIGCDIRNMSNDTKKILMNKEYIAINQDKLGQQGHKIKRTQIAPPGYDPEVQERLKLELVECNERKAQRWFINEKDFTIQSNNSRKLCIDVPHCNKNDSTVQTFTCGIGDDCPNHENQKWIYKENKIQSKMHYPDNLPRCLRVQEGTLSIIETHLCNESHTWEYNGADHTIKSNGKCLTAMDEATEVWAGNLSNGEYAILLLNRAKSPQKVSISREEIGFDNKTLKLRDLWEHKDLEFNNTFSVSLDSHDSLLLKAALIEPIPPTDTPTDTDSGNDDKYYYKVLIIVLPIMGGIIAICIGVIIYMYIKNRNKKKEQEDSEEKDKLVNNVNN